MAKKAPKKVGGQSPFAYAASLLDTASKRILASKPRLSAKKLGTDIASTFQTGVYNTSYGFSYGVIYSAVFITEFLPEDSTVLRGLEDGADAAFEARAKAKAKKKVVVGPAVEEKVETVEAKPETETVTPKAKAKRKPRSKVKAAVEGKHHGHINDMLTESRKL